MMDTVSTQIQKVTNMVRAGIVLLVVLSFGANAAMSQTWEGLCENARSVIDSRYQALPGRWQGRGSVTDSENVKFKSIKGGGDEYICENCCALSFDYVIDMTIDPLEQSKAFSGVSGKMTLVRSNARRVRDEQVIHDWSYANPTGIYAYESVRCSPLADETLVQEVIIESITERQGNGFCKVFLQFRSTDTGGSEAIRWATLKNKEVMEIFVPSGTNKGHTRTVRKVPQ